MARLANFADGWFVPLTEVNMAVDRTTVVLMTVDSFGIKPRSVQKSVR